MTWDRKAPFNEGGLMHHCGRYEISIAERQGLEIEWQSADEPRQLRLVVDTYARGRSAAYFIVKDQNDLTYPMFLSDFIDLIPHTIIDKGVVCSCKPLKYVVSKRGQNYGLKLAEQI